MSEAEYIVGLDIGSTTVRLAVGQLSQRPDQPVHIIGIAEAPSRGINRGTISSIEDAVSSISACLERAERMVGVPVRSVWLGISGSHITSQESRGVVAVARSDGEITEDDVERAIEAARAVATPPNYEILHVIPKNYVVDGQIGIKDPVGMTGVRLEVDTLIIQGLSTQIKNITKAVYRTGLSINDLVLATLATAEAVVSQRQKELGVVLVNIGGSATNLIVFEEGDVMHSAVLPIGSDHITSDIAIGLRISIDTAEKIKRTYGTVLAESVAKREEIDVAEFEGGEPNMVSRRYVADIIEARVEELLDKVDAELKKIDRSGKLPAGVVLTGGGAHMAGLTEMAKERLRLPASLGSLQHVTSALEKINDTSLSTVVGLVLWGNQASAQGGHGGLGTFMQKPMHYLKSVGNSLKGLFAKK